MDANWIAKRTTMDGKGVYLWPDGAITFGFGIYVKGSAHPRTPEQRAAALDAGWLILGEAEIYDSDELPALVSAARWCVAHGKRLPGDVRARLHEKPPLRPVWTVLEADRCGNPRSRCWRLPRLRWPGLAVFDDCGRYSVCQSVSGDTYGTPLVEFKSLRDLAAYLDSIASPGAFQ